MRIIELEIQNVRGIKHLVLRPDGKSLVIWGPNGSGKSGVVDSIDFLLTGNICRLKGAGTKDLSVGKHGPHIESTPENSFVRAVLKLNEVEELVEVRRCMAKPKELIFDTRYETVLKPVLAMASRGQYVLTRREILRFITAEAHTRASDIQDLLAISDIEKIRKNLVSVVGTRKQFTQAARQALEQNRGSIAGLVALPIYDETEVLKILNGHRQTLSAPAVIELKSGQVQSGIKVRQSSNTENTFNPALLATMIEALKDRSQVESLKEMDLSLRKKILEINTNPTLRKSLDAVKLTQLGLTLIDESGSCPLCEAEWDKEELVLKLNSRLEMAALGSSLLADIESLSKSLLNAVNNIVGKVRAITTAKELAAFPELKPLNDWCSNLGGMVSALSNPIESYLALDFDSDSLGLFLFPGHIDTAFDTLLQQTKNTYSEVSPEQNAWDTLTRLQTLLSQMEEWEANLEVNSLHQRRAEALSSAFQSARDTVLQRLYDEIKTRFVELYVCVHGDDEQAFNAEFEPDGAGLKFQVDFHGKGMFPPHALHSEGHQDSMGLCLYLALAEKLTEGLIDVVILDDVVMSVDAGHRKEICNLLKTCFPNHQFIITTHDRTWNTQLNTEGLVKSSQSVEFFNWDVATGPQVNYEVGLWQRIQSDIDKADIPSASAKLRRATEAFFRYVCDKTKAQVTFKMDGRWELGDLMPAAISRHKTLLKKASEAANSWNQRDIVANISEAQSTFQQIVTRTQAEQWGVNATVHYNEWHSLEKNDFIPIVEAFQDLFGAFTCPNCCELLHLTYDNREEQNYRCTCQTFNYNLVTKPKNPKNDNPAITEASWATMPVTK